MIEDIYSISFTYTTAPYSLVDAVVVGC